MLGPDPMMGAGQRTFDVAEQSVDGREELAGIGAVTLDQGVCFRYAPRLASRPRQAANPSVSTREFAATPPLQGQAIGFKQGTHFGPPSRPPRRRCRQRTRAGA
jgi:hypothetical protein